MAKFVKKHFGLGSKKGNSGSHRSEYSTQKSSSAQDLIPQSPTRFHQPSVVLSASSHHEFLDTHSLKSVASDSGGHSTGTRTHEHGCCKHHGCCRHQSNAGPSQRSSTSNEFGCRSIIHSSSVAEESDVFDETASDVTDVTELTLPNNEVVAPPPVLDEYCDPVDLKKHLAASDDTDLRGVYIPNHSLDDDYSVPYEVKKILSDAKLMERFPESESDGTSGKPVIDFDEPREWLAKLSSSDHQQNHQYNINQRTPLMTPKKLARPNATTSEQNSGKPSSPQLTDDELLTTVSDGELQQSDAIQLNDEVEEDIVASLIVDVNKEGFQLTDDERNDLSGMMVSLSVELESGNVSLRDETSRLESIAFAASPVKASAAGHKCNMSTINHKNCTLEHAHNRAHSNKTDAAAIDTETSTAALMSTQSTIKDTIDVTVPLEQQSWYHGALGRLEAEDLLIQQSEGSFLVRQSESNRLDFSLSLKSCGGVLHIKIVCHNGSYILGQFSQPFESVPHMVQFFSQGKLPIRATEEICLVYPVICSRP